MVFVAISFSNSKSEIVARCIDCDRKNKKKILYSFSKNSNLAFFSVWARITERCRSVAEPTSQAIVLTLIWILFPIPIFSAVIPELSLSIYIRVEGARFRSY